MKEPRRLVAILVLGAAGFIVLVAVRSRATLQWSPEQIAQILHTADTVIVTHITYEWLTSDSDAEDQGSWRMRPQPALDFSDAYLVSRLATLLAPTMIDDSAPCLCSGNYRVRFMRGGNTVLELTLHHWQHIRVIDDGQVFPFDLASSSKLPLQLLFAEGRTGDWAPVFGDGVSSPYTITSDGPSETADDAQP
jgi:hypothetical protein